MALVLFDLDDTLLDGDSATLWFAYLARLGWVDAATLAREQALMRLYPSGQMKMTDYMALTLAPLIGVSQEEVTRLSQHFCQQELLPRLFAQGIAQLAWHRQRGDRMVIITATGGHIVRPLLTQLGIDDLIAIEPEIAAGRYTGHTCGTLSYQQGKVTRLHTWLDSEQASLRDSFGYSDSINDLPLLQSVTHAHVVNPSATLAALAQEANWRVLQWQRDGEITHE